MPLISSISTQMRSLNTALRRALQPNSPVINSNGRRLVTEITPQPKPQARLTPPLSLNRSNHLTGRNIKSKAYTFTGSNPRSNIDSVLKRTAPQTISYKNKLATNNLPQLHQHQGSSNQNQQPSSILTRSTILANKHLYDTQPVRAGLNGLHQITTATKSQPSIMHSGGILHRGQLNDGVENSSSSSSQTKTLQAQQLEITAQRCLSDNKLGALQKVEQGLEALNDDK